MKGDMKRRTRAYSTILAVFSLSLLTVPSLSTLAQSGRVNQTAQPTPTPQTKSPKQPDAKRGFAIDRSADIYKLVFSTVARPLLSISLQHRIPDSEIWGREAYHDSFNPQDSAIVTAAHGTLTVWNTETKRLIWNAGGYKEITGAYFSWDGRLVITGGKYGTDKNVTTRVYDAESGKLKATLEGFTVFEPLSSLSSQAITIDDKDLKFWDISTGELRKTVAAYRRVHSDWHFFMDSLISPDGRLVLHSEGTSALLWEAETGQLRAQLLPPKDDDLDRLFRRRKLEIVFLQSRFSPDGQTVATVDSYNRIELWDTVTGKLRNMLVGHFDSIYQIEFSSDGRLLASASRDGTAKVWNISTGLLKYSFKAGQQVVRRVEFSPDARVLAVGSQDHATLWAVETGQMLAELSEEHDGIELGFSPDGGVLLTKSDKSIKAWNGHTGQLITSLDEARPPALFSSSGRWLATSGPDRSVLIWELTSH